MHSQPSARRDHDTDTDDDVNGSDSIYHFVYDKRWHIVGTYCSDDFDRKAQFAYHAAGAGESYFYDISY